MFVTKEYKGLGIGVIEPLDASSRRLEDLYDRLMEQSIYRHLSVLREFEKNTDNLPEDDVNEKCLHEIKLNKSIKALLTKKFYGQIGFAEKEAYLPKKIYLI